jgi:RHS repeat-associated protein
VTQSAATISGLAQPVTMTQGYDAASRRTSLFAAIGSKADFKNLFAYDNLDRLTSVTQQRQTGGNSVTPKRVDFGYQADGQLTQMTRFANLAGAQTVAGTAFGYDGAGRLTSLTHARNATVFAGYGFGYDAGNRMTSFTNSAHPAEGATYTNDATGQLTGADRTGSSSDEAYAYDANGNRITANGSTYATGANNRLLSDGTSTYSYDAEGNITKITNTATGAYQDLTWDYRNRLTQVAGYDASATQQWRVAYVYDSLNRLVERTEYAGGATTPSSNDFFAYDGYQMVLKLGTSGNVGSRNLWGNSTDQILATEDASGNVVWPLTDHLNTVRGLVSYHSTTDTTSLENHIVYDSFGKIVYETNPSVTSDFKFTARYTDARTGLQWNLNRWYAPTIGRWASEDPIGFAAGDPNLARYLRNRPTHFLDPTGLDDQPVTPPDATPPGFPGGLPPVVPPDWPGFGPPKGPIVDLPRTTCQRPGIEALRDARERLLAFLARNADAVAKRLSSEAFLSKLVAAVADVPAGLPFAEWKATVLQKLGAATGAELVRMASENGINLFKRLGYFPQLFACDVDERPWFWPDQLTFNLNLEAMFEQYLSSGRTDILTGGPEAAIIYKY